MHRFIRKQVSIVMDFPVSKILAWCVPLSILLTALVLVLLFGNKDIVNLVLYACLSGGSFVAGRLTKFPSV